LLFDSFQKKKKKRKKNEGRKKGQKEEKNVLAFKITVPCLQKFVDR